MAELVAEPLSFVVERLGDLLIQEAKFLGGVRGQVQQMQTELNRMQCFLKDADAKREEGDERVRNWVVEIREVAYDAEDVIETFVIKTAFRGRRSGILNDLMRCSRVFKGSVTLHKAGLEIESINTRISSITRSLQTYGIRATSEAENSSSRYEKQRQLRQSYPHIIEEDIVGLDEDLKAIVEHLVKEEKHCRVVSICGMGGLGKTTLAKKVYNHSDVRRHFDSVAWAYISQECNTREVLEVILLKLKSPFLKEREKIEEVKPNKVGEKDQVKKERERIKNMRHGELVEELYQFQSQKKCLVILDDIWEDGTWYSLSPGFPNTEVGSKILLTTRNRKVASHVDRQPFLHELRHLTEEESWELFQKKISMRREGFIRKDMLDLGKEMIQHCEGLPLAIVVLGGLLATKNMLDEWQMIRRNVSHYISKEKDRGGVSVKDILALSYQKLPYNLKACFLCLSNLPEDHGIRPEKLVQMWMAEGILSSLVQTQVGEEETMLDIGMSYLDELVQRCMIQVQFTRFSKRVKICRLHDLMRDFCQLKAQEENFFKVVRLGTFDHKLVLADSVSSSSLSSIAIRRLAVYYLGDRESRFGNPLCEQNIMGLGHHHIRSCQFYFFGNNLDGSSWRQIKSLFKGFKLLRYLDLEGIEISGEKKKLPTTIGSLIHLRYLSIRHSNIEELPSSIANLAFLQTLDLRVSCKIRIPNVLWRLEELRHLYLPPYRIKSLCLGKLRLDGLSKLETLTGFDNDFVDVRCFSKLTNLRRLEVELADDESLGVILKSPIFNNSNCLLQYSSFKIAGRFATKEEQSLLRQLLGFHHLHKLHLWGSLNLVKLSDLFHPNLTKLCLSESKLEEDPMPTLEKFPNLRSLTLIFDSYIGKEMVCSAPTPTPTPTTPSSSAGGGYARHGGFPQLKFLCLENIPNLEEWKVEEGAMPSLSHLHIDHCEQLKEIPEGLRFITTLRELKFIRSSSALRGRVQEGGEDFYKVQHVPSITIID